MNRLTKKNGNGGYFYPERFKRCDGYPDPGSCELCPMDTKICERLAAYEDTGLEPEEIAHKMDLLQSYQLFCAGRDLERMRELAKADKEGRGMSNKERCCENCAYYRKFMGCSWHEADVSPSYCCNWFTRRTDE